jgi:hypothetical protein
MSSTRLRASIAIAVVIVLTMAIGTVVLRSSRSENASADLLFNSGLEVLDSSGSNPSGWWRAGYGTNTASWWITSAAHGGKVAQGLRITKFTSGDRKLLTNWTGDGISVVPGRQYQLSAWYTTTGTTEIVAYTKNSRGIWSYWTGSPILRKVANWTRATFTTPAVPADTVGISFGVALRSTGTLITDDYAIDVTGSSSTTSSSTSTSASTSSSTSSSTTSTTSSTTTTTAQPTDRVQFSDSFTHPDGLMTNEYAFWNPTSSNRVDDPNWEMTSGSLFARSGLGWSGAPDNIEPNATSSNGTDSAIFRMVTRRNDFTNVDVSVRLRHEGFVATSSTPAVAWDGIHLFLRYVSEESLYYASVNRRDNTTQIKKKVPGGPSNGGTYYTLASGRFTVVQGSWQDVSATIVDRSDGAVIIRLFANGALVASAIDTGVGGPVLRSGGLGLRGDNSQFSFDDFVVRSIP